MNLACSFTVIWLVAVVPGHALRFSAEEDTEGNIAARLAKAENDLWDGLDLDETDESLVNVLLGNQGAQFQKTGVQKTNNSNPKHLILLGPFDSGTHLVRALMVKNFEDKWVETCEEKSYKENPNAVKAHCGIFKHGLDDAHSFRHILNNKDLRPQDVFVLVMVRSPVSQLASWKNDPFQLEKCVNREWSEMKEPCEARIGWPTTGEKPNAHIKFSSAADIYNHYTRMYQKIKDDKQFAGVAMTTYEDLVMSPRETIWEIAQTFGWKKKGGKINVDIAAKPKKPRSNGRKAAMEKLQSRSHLNEISSTDLSAICKQIDREAIGELAEGKHSGNPRHYMKDCDGEGLFSWTWPDWFSKGLFADDSKDADAGVNADDDSKDADAGMKADDDSEDADAA